MGRFIREAVENMDSALNITHKSGSDDQKSSININTSSTDGDITWNNERAEMRSSPEGSNNNNHTAFSDTWVDSSEGANKVITPQSTTPIDTPLKNRNDGQKRLKGTRNKRMLSNSSDALRGSDAHVINKMHCKAGTKMLIFSGHDSTMVPLLKAIGLYHGTYVKEVIRVMYLRYLILNQIYRGRRDSCVNLIQSLYLP